MKSIHSSTELIFYRSIRKRLQDNVFRNVDPKTWSDAIDELIRLTNILIQSTFSQS